MLHYFGRAFTAGNPSDFAKAAAWFGVAIAVYMVTWLFETGRILAGGISLTLFVLIAAGTVLVRRYAIHVDAAIEAEAAARASGSFDSGADESGEDRPPPPPSSAGCALLLVRVAAFGSLIVGIGASGLLYSYGRTAAALITAFLVSGLLAVGLVVRRVIAPTLQPEERKNGSGRLKVSRAQVSQAMSFVHLAGFLALGLGLFFAGYLLYSGRWVAGAGAAVMVLLLVGAAVLVRRVVTPTLESDRLREEMRAEEEDRKAAARAAQPEERASESGPPSGASAPGPATPGPAAPGAAATPKATAAPGASSSPSQAAPLADAEPVPPPRSNRSSRVDTRFLRMTLDHVSGAMSGQVIAGPDKGRALDQMALPDILVLMRRCRQADPPSAALLEAWLDRTQTVDWRAQAAASERMAEPPSMSVAEALAVLDLPSDASPEAMREAYRRLIGRLHPDHGGSKWLAAKVNEARDVLLRSVGNNRGA